MNRIYRLVFNRQLGVMQVASELASSTSGETASSPVPVAALIRPLAVCVVQALLLATAGSAFAADRVIFDGDARIDNAVVYNGGIVVGSDEAGTLRIVNGGHVTAGAASLIGQAKGSIGRVTVDGPDAWLKVSDASQIFTAALVVGEEGAGYLNILNGGKVQEEALGKQITFARVAGSSAEVVVDGQGSLLQSGSLLFGNAGSGSVTVSNGGKIVSTRTISTGIDVAYNAGSVFQLDILGSGSSLTAGSGMNFGRGGKATLNIKEGAVVNLAGAMLVADGAASSGNITVDGAGSSLSVGRDVTFADLGDASLKVTNGASVSTGSLWTSYGASDSVTTLLVDGAGSSLSTGKESLLIGRVGTSDLTITNGGQVNVGDAMIATSRGSVGSIVVDGPSSKLVASGAFAVGDSGKATLTIRNGGQVSAASMLLSDALLSAGTATTGKVTVDGAGSALTIAGDGLLTVGGTGNGTLDITNGGYVAAGNLTIGDNRSGYRPDNALTISGADSALDVGQVLRVADGTNGRLVVNGGAKVSADRLIQGTGDYEKGLISGGIIEIDGQGTQLTAREMDLRSQFTLKGGATASAETVTVANAPGVENGATITGAGTALTVNDVFTLEGNVDVTDGATVKIGSLQADYDGYALSGVQLHVSGVGSSFTSNGNITLASVLSQSSGTVLLSDGGYLTAGDNAIQIGTGGQLAFGANQTTDQAQAAGQLDSKTSIQLSGLGTVVLNHTGDSFELANTLASASYNTKNAFNGSLLSKAGTTLLTGDLHAFNGEITVQGGKLVLAGDVNTLPSGYSIDQQIGKDVQEVNVVNHGTLVVNGSLGYAWQFNAGSSIETRGASIVQVYGSTEGEAPVLAGSGSITGTVYVGDGGVISPGDGSVGTLTVNGDVYFTGNTVERAGVFAVDVKGDGTSDKLQVSGVADLRENASDAANATEVRVNALDPGTSYQNGQRYTILTATGGVQDTFKSVTSASAFLTPSLSYDANNVFLSLGLSINDVESGKVLSGGGSYGSTRILSGGTLSPGDASAPIGAISFSDLAFAEGSFYDVDVKGAGVSASTSAIRAAAVDPVNDVVNVTGVATLDGGTVRVTALDPQTSYQDGHAYTILSAQGGVAGTFDGSLSRSAFLTTELSYTVNDVLLKIGVVAAGGGDGGSDGGNGGDGSNGGGGNGTGEGNPGGGSPGASTPPPIFETVSVSRNQYNIAQALDTLPQQGEALALYNQLLMQDADSARAAFGSLSGEVHAAARSALLDDRFLQDGVRQRLQGQVVDMDDNGLGVWVAGSGTTGHLDGDENAARTEGQRQGLMGGADWALGEDTVIGVVAGNEDIQQRVPQWRSTADIDANTAGVYAATHWGALSLLGGVNYADYDVDTRRQAVVGATVDQSINASYKAHATTFYAEGGWDLVWDTLSLTPYLAVAHTRLETDGATEAGGSTALVVSDSKDELLTSTAGVRAAWDISGGQIDGAVLTAGLAWQNASGELKADSRARFASGSDSFTVYGTPLARNVAIAELGVGVNTGTSSRLSLSAQGRAGDGQREFGAQLNWAWKF